MPAHDAPNTVADGGPGPLLEAVERLEQHLASVDGQTDAGVQSTADDLAALEHELFRVLQAHADDPTLTGDRGHPALASVHAWRIEAEHLEEHGAASEVEGFLETLLTDEAERWRRSVDQLAYADGARDPLPQRCFDALRAATALEREALAVEASDRDEEALLGSERDALRQRFAAALERADSTAAARHDWSRELLDASDEVLTSVDDLPPDLAARHLELLADDVSWHTRHVEEKGRGGRRAAKRKLRRLRVEAQEKRLQGALERRFGSRAVARFERLVIWLIFLVLAILVVETTLDLPAPVRMGLALVDTAACGVFLLEFFVKLRLVKGKRSWFLRHALIDLLPSLPFGLLTFTDLAAQHNPRWARALRLLRLTRATRYLRFLLPLIRLVRAFGFLSRGLDRLFRRYGELLNRNVILFPRREERVAARQQRAGPALRLWRLRARLGEAWNGLVKDAPTELRAGVIHTRLEALRAARGEGLLRRPPRPPQHAQRAAVDVPADVFFERLASITPGEVQADLGQDFVARCARAARVFARPPLRWLPFLRRAVPKLAPGMTDAEVTAAAGQSLSAELQRHHERVFWFADLYGTVTPAEFVDRVGTTMFRAARRPASRLLLFGGLLLLVRAISGVFGLGKADLPGFLQTLDQVVGNTLMLLGGICLVILGLGWWMKNLAGQATAFYEQMAQAQYLALTESIKGRFLARDAALFDARVLAPEDAVIGEAPEALGARRERFLRAIRGWLIAPTAVQEPMQVSQTLDRVVMLYRDSLDGALFGDSDVRTTSQLLGDPSLQQMRASSQRIDRRARRTLDRLDLSRKRSLFGGPYLWLSFITKAITQQVARLIVDYNRHAIPQHELAVARPDARVAYEAWLRGEHSAAKALHAPHRTAYLTTSFKALHFLDDDVARDQEVAHRYGEAVLTKLQSDRRALIREIFGTYPRHLRAKERRVVNLYHLYESWLMGGRAFLIPLRLLWRGLRSIGTGVAFVAKAVAELRRSAPAVGREAVEHADFVTAMRKIDRMRRPIVRACLLLRAQFDPAYLGVRMPGVNEQDPAAAPLEGDLLYMRAGGELRRQVKAERAVARADMRRLARLYDQGLQATLAAHIGVDASALGAEHLRAAAIAYRGDYRGVRRLLSAETLLLEAQAEVLDHPLARRAWLPAFGLRRAFRRWRSEHGPEDRTTQRAFWRAIRRDRDGLRRVLMTWTQTGAERARVLGTEALADILRHPSRITEQIVTLRAVQTLSLIDLLNYREHVYRLGGYEDSGDEPGPSLPTLAARA